MSTADMISWGLKATWLLFVFAYGASLGSLINVIVYRMPRGISIVTPPSRCPKCNTRLSWRDNIPVLGWIFLGGRCRYCKARISPEYPLVEFSVGLLFAAFYAMWYMIPQQGLVFAGIDITAMRPDWAMNDALQTWPTFVLLLILLGALVAMTLVDAKTFTIPLVLTWVPAGAAVIIHPLHAAWLSDFPRLTTAPSEVWAIPTPGQQGWGGIGVALGGIIGLGLANLLLTMGLFRRSFADYPEWEEKARAAGQLSDGQANSPPTAEGPTATSDNPAPVAEADRAKIIVVPDGDTAVTLTASPDPSAPQAEGSPADLWIQYPHARREMFKELIFLAPVMGLAMLGFYLGRQFGGVRFDPMTGTTYSDVTAPLWLTVLAGVFLGYLIGGGVVWAIRIFGSLAFGKEAMGLGDVHLMAAVGACLGWIDATLAFFGAAFVGIAWTLVSLVAFRGVQRAMPYGPFLAVSTILVLILKPWIELGLSRMFQTPINIP
jgi:leader peptidase (prepilin peptidase) / N-methyltransferase